MAKRGGGIDSSMVSACQIEACRFSRPADDNKRLTTPSTAQTLTLLQRNAQRKEARANCRCVMAKVQ
jgi:hypothetical protein